MGRVLSSAARNRASTSPKSSARAPKPITQTASFTADALFVPSTLETVPRWLDVSEDDGGCHVASSTPLTWLPLLLLCLALLWRRTVKPLYVFVTRRVLHTRDGEIGRPSVGPWPRWTEPVGTLEKPVGTLEKPVGSLEKPVGSLDDDARGA